ncbi:MAG: solute carrier family 23 protein [Dysosmobacter sp.]
MKERNLSHEQKLGHDAIYDARELGVPWMLLLGLQHLFAMFGATVLSSSAGLLVSTPNHPDHAAACGLGTSLFHVCTKLKIPAFRARPLRIWRLPGHGGPQRWEVRHHVRQRQAGLPWAVSWWRACCIWCWRRCSLAGAQKVMRFFPPIVTGPVIILII